MQPASKVRFSADYLALTWTRGSICVFRVWLKLVSLTCEPEVVHLRYHTGRSPYLYLLCTQGLKDRWVLDRHFVHAGLGPR